MMTTSKQTLTAAGPSRGANLGLVAFVSWSLASCAPEVEDTRPFIDHDLWVLSPVSEDPFINERGSRPACDVSALSWEVDGFEVSTETCGYVTVEQPIGASLKKGEQLQLDLSWGPLLATSPTLAVIEFQLNGKSLFQEEIAIPSSADIRSLVLTSPVAADAGSTLYFHIRNHGTNSYQLRDLAIAP